MAGLSECTEDTAADEWLCATSTPASEDRKAFLQDGRWQQRQLHVPRSAACVAARNAALGCVLLAACALAALLCGPERGAAEVWPLRGKRGSGLWSAPGAANFSHHDYELAFRRTGCPDPQPGVGTVRWWAAHPDRDTWRDMYFHCFRVSRGKAGPIESRECCGARGFCRPACKMVRSWGNIEEITAFLNAGTPAGGSCCNSTACRPGCDMRMRLHRAGAGDPGRIDTTTTTRTRTLTTSRALEATSATTARGFRRHGRSTYIATFGATGCTNMKPDSRAMHWWRTVKSSTVWDDMYRFCRQVETGTASALERQTCCGQDATRCAPTCRKQQRWTRGRSTLDQVPAGKDQYILTFQMTGCPNAAPQEHTLQWWRSQEDEGRVWDDMHAYCLRTACGTASPDEADDCCGGMPCKPRCMRQHGWVTEEGAVGLREPAAGPEEGGSACEDTSLKQPKRVKCDGVKDWPDVKNGLVCGDCKVLVQGYHSKYQTCDNYCLRLSRPCVGAWEDDGDTCGTKYQMGCDHSIYSEDAICQCGEVVEDRAELERGLKKPAYSYSVKSINIHDFVYDALPGELLTYFTKYRPHFAGASLRETFDCARPNPSLYFSNWKSASWPLFHNRTRFPMAMDYLDTSQVARPSADRKQTVLGFADMQWPYYHYNGDLKSASPYLVISVNANEYTERLNYEFVECSLLGWPGFSPFQHGAYPVRVVLKNRKHGKNCSGLENGMAFCNLETSWGHNPSGNNWRFTIKEIYELYELCTQKYTCDIKKVEVDAQGGKQSPFIFLFRIAGAVTV